MRRWICVPMMALCLLLAGCGGEKSQKQAAAARKPYQDMTGCKMAASVTCGTGSEDALTFTMMTVENRGVKATAATVKVLVRGTYSVA